MSKINIVQSPFRISLFGGSTDYKNFYKENGAFLIGTPIDKYCYLSMRYRPNIFNKKYLCTYSKYELVDSIEDLENPLIKETLKYFNINKPIELTSFSDIPSRTGLGGSSSYCVAMAYLIKIMNNQNIDAEDIINSCIKIEREILNESGGIQDQIWPFAKGFSSITIDKLGNYFITKMPISDEFGKELENSMTLIFTEEQRNSDIAKLYEDNFENKKDILQMSYEAYDLFINENLDKIGNLLYKSWLSKEKISSKISNLKINDIINDVIYMGAYGAKLLGSGGSGFILVMSDIIVKEKIYEKYKQNILDFKIAKSGITKIY